MTAEEKLQAQLHSRTNQFSRHVDEARRYIDQAYQTQAIWFASVSGGKDSQVVFDLVSDVPGIFSDDEFWFPETETFIHHLQAVRDVRWIRTNATHTGWFSVKGDYNGIQDYAQQQGFSGVFLGLRRQENKYRRVYLDSRPNVHQVQKDGFWHCNPLSAWSTWDVWAYIISKGLEYNHAYDKLSELRVPFERRRIGPFANVKALTMGQIAILKQGWPECYNKFVQKHPEAARYI